MVGDSIKLSLDKINVESTSTSIVREYLARKGFKDTLKKLDEECPRDEKSLNSRTKIIEYLNIGKLYESNKKLTEPYAALLEVIMSYLVMNDLVSNKSENSEIKSNQYTKLQVKKEDSFNNIKKMGSKPSANDMRIDDTEEGELADGSEKRFKNEKKQEEKPKKLTTSTNKKSSLANETSKTERKSRAKNEIENQGNDEDFINSKLFGTKLNDESKIKPTNNKNNDNDLLKTLKFNDNDDELDDFDKLLKEKARKMQAKSPTSDEETPSNVANTSSILPTESSVNKPKEAKIIQVTPTIPHEPLSNTTKIPPSTNLNANSGILNSTAIKKDYQITSIDYQTAVALKTLIFGNANTIFTDEWKYQSFQFCDYVKLKYGLVQKKGGPCGVLASVQAHFLLQLLFIHEDKCTTASFDVNKKERSRILAIAISNLLWKCGQEHNEATVCVSTNKAHFAPVGKYKSDGITETLNLLRFNNYKSLEDYLIKNVTIFENEENYGVILLLYSAIFSRTINSVQGDMDDPNSKLMGQHFYCTQDMVNLLIHGKAYSNVFNDTIYVDEVKLRGPDRRNEIGLLSLFEHYKSCEVGSYYKTPKYPIWVICSESHFSVLFSLKKEILSDWKAETKFDLYYYDGLARQDEQIKLTLECVQYMFSKGRSNKKNEMVPPLELVIQTKWKDASIDWNGYEPIL